MFSFLSSPIDMISPFLYVHPSIGSSCWGHLSSNYGHFENVCASVYGLTVKIIGVEKDQSLMTLWKFDLISTQDNNKYEMEYCIYVCLMELNAKSACVTSQGFVYNNIKHEHVLSSIMKK